MLVAKTVPKMERFTLLSMKIRKQLLICIKGSGKMHVTFTHFTSVSAVYTLKLHENHVNCE